MIHPSLHDAIKADMERALEDSRRRLDAVMFRSDPFLRAVPPPTVRQRLRWKLRRVRTYFVTRGRALRGDDLDYPSESDDY